MKVIAFITEFSAVDRIIHHIKLTFVADKPPPPRIAYQELLMAADASAEYFS
ncbi:MAG: acid--CoA ligase [Candidatus Aminicenantales bacterium]